MDNTIGKVPIHLKMTLTAKEAAEYSNIGINKIDSMLRSPNCPFVLYKALPLSLLIGHFEDCLNWCV